MFDNLTDFLFELNGGWWGFAFDMLLYILKWVCIGASFGLGMYLIKLLF